MPRGVDIEPVEQGVRVQPASPERPPPSLTFVGSTTSVSPTQRPMESPIQPVVQSLW